MPTYHPPTHAAASFVAKSLWPPSPYPTTPASETIVTDNFPVAAFSWTLAHPWGWIEPYVVCTRDDGRSLVVGPEFNFNSVTVTFVVETAGTMTLIDPDPGTLMFDVAVDASGVEWVPTSVVRQGTTAGLSGGQGTYQFPAIVKPGQGAVITDA